MSNLHILQLQRWLALVSNDCRRCRTPPGQPGPSLFACRAQARTHAGRDAGRPAACGWSALPPWSRSGPEMERAPRSARPARRPGERAVRCRRASLGPDGAAVRCGAPARGGSPGRRRVPIKSRSSSARRQLRSSEAMSEGIPSSASRTDGATRRREAIGASQKRWFRFRDGLE